MNPQSMQPTIPLSIQPTIRPSTRPSTRASTRALVRLARGVCGTLCVAALLACGPTPPPVSAVAEVSDIDVTAKVKTALLRVPSLQGKQIGVVTTQGDVRLTAVLDNQDQIDTARRITRETDGVHSVHDELTLKP